MINWQAEYGRRSLIGFTEYTKPEYTSKWYHRYIAEKLEKLYSGEIKKLMLFVPPQHGKSELVSRRFPAYCLGKNPKLKIVVCSYSQSLSMQFNRETQRIIDDEKYRQVFESTLLSGKSDETIKRTASEFETNHFGRLMSVGVGTGLTGHSVDIGIIDDPVKDAMQAYSITYRDNVWDWYRFVFSTRLHNDSRQLLTMTRWHEDDLAGRILKNENDWEVIIFPAIKENNNNQYDPRQIGESLWPEKHSSEKILSVKNISATVFNSLYQQRPAPDEGAKIKIEWINRFNLRDFENYCYNEDIDLHWNFTIDGAYTTNENNDATAILCFAIVNKKIYIRDVKAVRLEMPELLNFIPSFCRQNGYNKRSSIWIEPKANGLSVAQMIRSNTDLNIIIDKAPTGNKETRVDRCIPFIQSGKVYILENSNFENGFFEELKYFPFGSHDDMVDCLTMAIDKVEVSKEMQIFGFSAI